MSLTEARMFNLPDHIHSFFFIFNTFGQCILLSFTAPTRAPPPPPSAPPPSTLPPSLPVAGTVGGFGADVNSVPLG